MPPPVDSPQPPFAAALLKPDAMTPAGFPAKRFAVYRNNVAVSLIEALMAAYPAVLRLLGEEYFRALAGEFVRAHPPRSPVLLAYGDGFGAFIDAFPPLADYPWLGDVARLERAWSEAYHAADAPPLAPDALAGIAPERLAGLRLIAHPAARVLRSCYPQVTIFRANRQDGAPRPIRAGPGEDALITRPVLDVAVRCLPDGGAAFLQALLGGDTLGAAAAVGTAAAETSDGDFDLAANIAGMLEAGVFSAIARCD